MSTEIEEETLVMAMNVAMRGKLRNNRTKRHWRHLSVAQLLSRLDEEVAELRLAATTPNPDAITVLDEAADVANFAAFVADVVHEQVRSK